MRTKPAICEHQKVRPARSGENATSLRFVCLSCGAETSLGDTGNGRLTVRKWGKEKE